jgi:hypothetical protein
MQSGRRVDQALVRFARRAYFTSPDNRGGTMRKMVTLFLAALLLSGCVAEWKSHKTGARWHNGPGTTPPPDVESGSATTP